MKLRRVIVNYDPVILSLLTVLLGLWFIMFVDLTRPTYLIMVSHVTGAYYWINGSLHLSPPPSDISFTVAKIYWGGSAFIFGLLDLFSTLYLQRKWRQLFKAILFAYWIQIFFFLGIGNFYTTAFPMYLTICVKYAILYLRIEND